MDKLCVAYCILACVCVCGCGCGCVGVGVGVGVRVRVRVRVRARALVFIYEPIVNIRRSVEGISAWSSFVGIMHSVIYARLVLCQ